MKKKIEADLAEIAEKILQNKGNFNTMELKENALLLYEKLTVLAFTEKHLSEEVPQQKEAVKQEEEATPKPKVKDLPEPPAQLSAYDEFYPDGTEFNEDSDAITEPNTEKIKDIVAQMPPESQSVDLFMNHINDAPEVSNSAPYSQQVEEKKDFRNIGVDYDNLPDFEPVKHVPANDKPRSLNDRLKKGINIGLNERLAYIKHLFGGDTADYNRVLSQLNTFTSLEEASKFIDLVVKPDYNNWQGKEAYEERFRAHIQNKFGK
ncbi:hypothetical protein [Christiangramia sp. OXR-203]|jgi:hypothetical protein|uniref:hypothetical protein n=1 Tax=Christiangramia sp. OXR-203 TaxID=3100176 RepID=UPI002AC98D22|nr:hypothetical protein [Christiangramia sp. OXR-203]WPY98648.1 hypothetical protein T8I65_00190 [Christiangramia sp. OXR-203]